MLTTILYTEALQKKSPQKSPEQNWGSVFYHHWSFRNYYF